MPCYLLVEFEFHLEEESKDAFYLTMVWWCQSLFCFLSFALLFFSL